MYLCLLSQLHILYQLFPPSGSCVGVMKILGSCFSPWFLPVHSIIHLSPWSKILSSSYTTFSHITPGTTSEHPSSFAVLCLCFKRFPFLYLTHFALYTAHQNKLWLVIWLSHLPSLVDDTFIQFSSVQFSRSVMSGSLRPHELQHARPLCPSSTPGVHWDSRP